jgi:hypothetical protein
MYFTPAKKTKTETARRPWDRFAPSPDVRAPGRRRTGGGVGTGTMIPPTLRTLCDPKVLVETYYRMRRGGQAAGPDGVTYTKLGPSEVWAICRALAKAIKHGTWRPGPERLKRILKANGIDYRTLKIANLFDRVVARALTDLLTPVLDPTFLPNAVGFRPGRDPWLLLARLQAVVPAQGRWVVAAMDIEKAFDNVPVDRAIDALARHVTDQPLLELIARTLRGPDNSKVGIAQGNALSPLALNGVLRDPFDVPFFGTYRCSGRYADDFVACLTSTAEGTRAIRLARSLLHPLGMTLKGTPEPIDLLAGGRIEYLGFSLSHESGKLRIDLGDGAWTNLERHLRQAYQSGNPPETATHAIEGWVAYLGPAFEDGKTDVLDRILRTAAELGFREIDPDRVGRAITRSREKWINFKRKLDHDPAARLGVMDGWPAPPPHSATPRHVATSPASHDTGDPDRDRPARAGRPAPPARPTRPSGRTRRPSTPATSIVAMRLGRLVVVGSDRQPDRVRPHARRRLCAMGNAHRRIAVRRRRSGPSTSAGVVQSGRLLKLAGSRVSRPPPSRPHDRRAYWAALTSGPSTRGLPWTVMARPPPGHGGKGTMKQRR